MSRRELAIALTLLLAACTYSAEHAPLSSPSEVGVSVTWEVDVHCGLDNALFDLDGSLWVPTTIQERDREGVPEGFGYYDTGTLTLVSEGEAQYRSSKGRVISLTRFVGNFVTSSC
jgi:hypothetical protein